MQPIRILLVEDEEHLLEAIKLNLELEGYKVVAATNGTEAVRVFRQERFNLVVLDVMLPELDGFAVCESIRLTNWTVPILFLSAKNAAEDKITGLKRGADDYMTAGRDTATRAAAERKEESRMATVRDFMASSRAQVVPSKNTRVLVG